MTSMAQESPRGSLRLDRSEVLSLAAALLCALGMRFAFYGGIVSIDDVNYLRHAAELMAGRFDPSQLLYLHGTRPLVFYPVAWLFGIFGVSEPVAIAWPLFASMCTIVLVYLLGRTLLDRERARYAVLFAVFLPLLVRESARLLPGAIMNLVIASSALCFVLSEFRARRGLWLFVSGALYGIIQLSGELGLLFGLFFPAAVLIWGRHSFWSYWPVAAGFILMMGASVAHVWIATGDPFFKSALSQTILVTETRSFDPLYYVNHLVRPFASHGGVFYLSGLGAVAAIRSRDRAALMLLVWMVLSWAVMEFGSSSLSEYRPLYKYGRYLSIISIPGVLLAANGVVFLRKLVEPARSIAGLRIGARLVVSAVVLTFFTTSLVTLAKGHRSTTQLREGLERVRDQVRAYDGQTIYVTHWLWNNRAAFYLGFEDGYFPSGYHPYHAVNFDAIEPGTRIVYVQTLSPGAPMDAGLLINDERFLDASRGLLEDGSLQKGEIPDVLVSPPPGWRLIDRVPIASRRIVSLYEIPTGSRWPE